MLLLLLFMMMMMMMLMWHTPPTPHTNNLHPTRHVPPPPQPPSPSRRQLLRAPVAYFDVTPIGRILNRFSKDMNMVDMNLTGTLNFALVTAFILIASLVVRGRGGLDGFVGRSCMVWGRGR
jgi:hypothetical protein